jgi:hypothetical protein
MAERDLHGKGVGMTYSKHSAVAVSCYIIIRNEDDFIKLNYAKLSSKHYIHTVSL